MSILMFHSRKKGIPSENPFLFRKEFSKRAFASGKSVISIFVRTFILINVLLLRIGSKYENISLSIGFSDDRKEDNSV